MHFKDVFFCDDCHIGFTSKKLLNAHLVGTARHCGKQYSCKLCDTVFSRASNLNAHVRVQHKSSVTLPHTCGSCSKSFEHERGLQVHQGKCKLFCENKTKARVAIADTHTGTKPFQFWKYVYECEMQSLKVCPHQIRVHNLYLSTLSYYSYLRVVTRVGQRTLTRHQLSDSAL